MEYLSAVLMVGNCMEFQLKGALSAGQTLFSVLRVTQACGNFCRVLIKEQNNFGFIYSLIKTLYWLFFSAEKSFFCSNAVLF